MINQLAGKSIYYNNSQSAAFTSHYHVDIVPTIYDDGYFNEINTFQYTYTHSDFEVQHMPVVYFNYHIGGLSVYV